NRTLPLVKRIVQDVMSVYPEWKDLVAQYELRAAQARPEWGESQEQIALKAQIDSVATKINGFLGELEEIGCEFKGFDLGLVVFSGFVLSVPYFSSATVPTWLMAMQTFGLLGAIVVIGIVTPTAARLGRLEVGARGELPESFTGLRRRQAIFATLAGILALFALLSGTLFRS